MTSIVTALRTSSILPRVEKSSVGGMEIRTVADLVVVLHAVLARDAGDAVGGRDVVEGLVGPDELGELVLAVGVFSDWTGSHQQKLSRPARRSRAAAHGDRVPDRLVDGAGRHVVGVDVAVAGADAVGDDDALKGVEERPDHGGVARAVVDDAGQGLDHASPLDLVVVLADDGFLAADVEPGEHRLQGLAQVRRFRESRLRVARGRPAARRSICGQAVVEEVHVQIGHGLFPVADVEPCPYR